MKIFILEDDPTRIRWMRARLFNHDLTIVDSCKDVDKFQPPYDLILLDHDLGGRQMTQHGDNGARFASLIADRVGDALVIVHSYNYDGAYRILAALQLPESHYLPFGGPDFCAALDKNLGALR